MTNTNYIPVDLHAHSTYSDGALNLNELLTMVKTNGGKYFALTDHDTVTGILKARQIAQNLGLILIAGVEISVTWENSLVHIVGLGVDPTNPELITQLAALRALRLERGQKIAHNLAKIGLHGAFEGAMHYCTHPESLSRTHFNQWLIAAGHAKAGKAFDRYLAPGKPGYVSQQWMSLANALTLIKNSGGIAVLAHPGRYKFTRTKLIRLINEFKANDGIGMEVISSSHSIQDEVKLATLCRITGLLASVGSDFHSLNAFRKITPGINKAPSNGLATVFPHLNINLDDYLS